MMIPVSIWLLGWICVSIIVTPIIGRCMAFGMKSHPHTNDKLDVIAQRQQDSEKVHDGADAVTGNGFLEQLAKQKQNAYRPRLTSINGDHVGDSVNFINNRATSKSSVPV